jgi:hypothetical protein
MEMQVRRLEHVEKKRIFLEIKKYSQISINGGNGGKEVKENPKLPLKQDVVQNGFNVNLFS